MKKVVQRTAQAQRQVARRAREQADRQTRMDRDRNRTALQSASAEIRQNLKDARSARLDAWERGPLAPKRDIGIGGYGTFTERLRQDWSNGGYSKLSPELLEQRCGWAGGPRQISIVPGDRVVLLDGLDKGKIDRVKTVDEATASVTLENTHKGATTPPLGESASQLIQMPISLGSVRLVYPIKNPETGITKDTMINQLRTVGPNMQSPNMNYDRWRHGKKWDRVALGINVVIPWPDVKAPALTTHEVDTVREQVDERTFYYGLLSAPMPEAVLDELRNKYSRFRTRHEAWYVEQKEAEAAAKKGRQEILQSMRTPLDEFNEMKAQRRAEAGEPELTDEMLERLGGIMASRKTAALGEAGITEVSPGAPVQVPTPPPS